VLVVDKARFPREKVCGDGLTPRAVRALQGMGIDTEGPSWARARGLRIIGGGVRLELPWPELNEWPGYALVRTRLDFDSLLLDSARKAGAEVWEETEVTGPIIDERGVVRGVRFSKDGDSRQDKSRRTGEGRRENGDRGEVEAATVIVGDGVANRFGIPLGIKRVERRPMGVAVRTYFRSARWTDDFLESYLELWRGNDLMPGYGWIFPLPDGTVNIGLGLLNTSKHFQTVDYKRLLWDWVAGLPPEWGLTRENQIGKIRGGSLPMGFNRLPVARPGLLLVGDAAGAVNPFNGEGIAYAMETAEIAAEIADEAVRTGDPRALRAYPDRLRDAYEGYFILGRAFVRLIGNGTVMRTLTRYGLPREGLMRFALKILGNLTDPRDGSASDRLINAMVKMAPAINTIARQ
jgi:geranylgeranyl reductase family protein